MTGEWKYDDGGEDVPLFDMTPAARSPRPLLVEVRPEAWASCPRCSAIKIALLGHGAHFTWDRHTYVTWSGVTMECSSSGVALCVLQPKDGHMLVRATKVTRSDGEKLRRPARCVCLEREDGAA
jgi:uncharacterized C2H2 Zn-finger protein